MKSGPTTKKNPETATCTRVDAQKKAEVVAFGHRKDIKLVVPQEKSDLQCLNCGFLVIW